MKKIKVGIAGIRRGFQIYRHLLTMRDVQVTAVADPQAERFHEAERFAGVRRFDTFATMLDSGIDAVVIATPLTLHAEQTIAALERGIHVLCEVTAATTLEECRALLQAGARSRAKYMAAENFCYFRENVAVRNMVRAGLFGQIYYAEGEYIGRPMFPAQLVDGAGNPTWRKTLLADKRGCLYGTHGLGPVLGWFDEPISEVSCFGSGNYTEPSCRADNTTQMMCRTARTSALIRVRVDHMTLRPNNYYFGLQGTKASYEAPRSANEMHRIWFHREPYANAWEPFADCMNDFLPREMADMPAEARDSLYGGADYFMTKDFIQCILEDKPSPLDLGTAVRMAAPCIVSEQSIEAGGVPVAVPDLVS